MPKRLRGRRKGSRTPRKKLTHNRKSSFRLLAEWRARVRIIADQKRAELLLQAVIIPEGPNHEGMLIKAVPLTWFAIVNEMTREPNFMFQLSWRKWEEMLASAYKAAGYDEVTLTPPSADFGRDVIATKHGVGSIRIIGQMKRYAAGNPVPANDVRALLGVLNADQKASKAILTTTSSFAPGIPDDPYIKPFLPTRLELISGNQLLPWLEKLATTREPHN